MAKWFQVLEELTALVYADAELASLYGENIRASGTGEKLAPLLEIAFVGDSESELWNPITVQFDQFLATADDLAASELRLRRHFHANLPIALGGISAWAEYVDGGSLSIPSLDGYFGRAARFRLTPLRDYYDPVPPTS